MIVVTLITVFALVSLGGSAGRDTADPTHVIDAMITNAINERAFPGAVVLVGTREGILYEKAFGTLSYDPDAPTVHTGTVYDLASMTKVIATTSAVMVLYERGDLKLDDAVVQFIPELTGDDVRNLTIRHLLAHTGGFPSWKNYFETATTREQLMETLLRTPLETSPGHQYLYSDIGMIILGEIIERITGERLDTFVADNVFKRLGMVSTYFNPPEELRRDIAPTEIDTTWRMRLIQGEVHDENAYVLGGVAGHAGLFSNAVDLSRFAQMMLNNGEFNGTRIFNPETVRTFTQRTDELSSRALGWDTRGANGSSSAGTLLSESAYGHTGFTGTSIWIDPYHNIFVIFLTNRIHPSRNNPQIISVRPQLHDVVMRIFRLSGS